MDAGDVPEFAQLGKSRLKHTDRRGIVDPGCWFHVRPSEMATCASAAVAGIDAAVADVSDLETAVAAVLEKANPIVRRQAADMKVRAQRAAKRLSLAGPVPR